MRRIQPIVMLAGVLALAHCQKDRASARVIVEPAAPASSPQPSSPVASSTAGSSVLTSNALSGASLPSAPAEVNASPPGALSEWLDASLYQFKASGVHACSAKASSNGAALAPQAATRLAITVQIKAKVDSLLASPRDLTLERDGVILQAELNPGATCGVPLASKQLRRGESALGLVLFDLPDTGFAKGSVLRVKPTRWGGAPGLAVAIP